MLKKPNVVVSFIQFEVLKKVLRNSKLTDKEEMVVLQLQRPGFPKSGGFLLDKSRKINDKVVKGTNFCVNSDFSVVIT